MADDCVCTALNAICTMQSDLFTQIVNKLNSISLGLENISNRLQMIEVRMRYMDDEGITVGMTEELRNIKIELNNINTKLIYDNKNIAEIWSYKELCVSNETIVESPMSTFVSKAKLEIDE